jgi:hypothetical protein
MSLTLEPLDAEKIAQWDSLISGFPQRRVFHRQAWFDYLVEAHQAEWKYWAVVDHGRTVGYFSGGVIQRGPFRILGSPLRTWSTNHIGPLLEEGVDGRTFVSALDDLAREEDFSVIEIEYPAMPHDAYEARGFACHQTWTNQLSLSTDLDLMLQGMSRQRRSGISKAQRYGLEVVECPNAAIRVHDQLSRALHSKGAVCPFPVTFPQAIVRHLDPLGLIFMLGIRNAAGEVVAAGLFPHDNGTVYLWECSSELEGRELHPNELLFWGLMCRAAERGISVYDMSGYGRFNKGFGGELVAVHRWNKCYSMAARSARDVFEKILKLNRRDTFLSRLLSPVVR